MYCKYCGGQIADKAVYCVHCGVFLNGVPQSERASEPQRLNRPESVNGLALSGFILAISSIVLGMILVYINVSHYAGMPLQFFCAIPLVTALGLSIAGTVRAKKTKSGLGFGIAGIVISGGAFVLTVVYCIFMLLMVYGFILFLMLLI